MQVKQRLCDAVVERYAAQVVQGLHVQQVLQTQNQIIDEPESVTPIPRPVVLCASYLGKSRLAFAVFVSPAGEKYSFY